MVGEDCIDPETGLRFIEDIRGGLHLIQPHHDMQTPTEPVEPVINNYYNTTNNYITPAEPDYANADKVILHAYTKTIEWATDTNYNRIPVPNGGFLNYTVPFGKEFHVKSIVLANYRDGNQNKPPSHLGIFVDGNMLLPIPVIIEVNYEFPHPLILVAGSFLELKFKPFNKKVEVSVVLLGYLL